eukprot:435131_1
MPFSGDTSQLSLDACIGFSGRVLGGLQYTSCGRYTVYPMGSIIVVRCLVGKKIAILEGHTQDVSCLSLSRDGKCLASGQANHMGVKCSTILWDMDEAKRVCEEQEAFPQADKALRYNLVQHFGKVQAVDFSSDGKLLATLGGADDKNLIIWSVENGKPICGSPAASDPPLTIRWLNNRPDRLISAGNDHLKVWQVDITIPKLHAVDAKMGSLHRAIQCISISNNDKVAYCGTTTGDVMRVSIDCDNTRKNLSDPEVTRPTLRECGTKKFSQGIKSIYCYFNEESERDNVIVGGGDGTIAVINNALNKICGASTSVQGAVTSIAVAPGDQSGFFCGTDLCNRYWIKHNKRKVTEQPLEKELRATAHHGKVHSATFPANCSSLLVTCSVEDIRVWDVKQQQERLRIQVPNLDCNCIGVTQCGSAIVSGWSDGKIRSFYPETGKLMFTISNAHQEGVTALGITSDDYLHPPWRLISGGIDGRVCVWNIFSSHQVMAMSVKEHRGGITCLTVNRDSTQCVSGSMDGSCILWDLIRGVRLAALIESTKFRSVLYYPDESQYLTCGSNRRITYWDAYDSSQIRVIEGGEKGMMALDMEEMGEWFVSGGEDALVKVWDYDDGLVKSIGRGHSGCINSVKISPDKSYIASVGDEGGIFFWSRLNVEEERTSQSIVAGTKLGG